MISSQNQLLSYSFRDSGDRMLRRWVDIRSKSRKRYAMSKDRVDIDDHPIVVRFLHQAESFATALNQTSDICVHDFVELFERFCTVVQEGHVSANPRIVHENVYDAELLLNPLEGFSNRIRVRNIALVGESFPFRRSKSFNASFDFFGPSCQSDDG